MGIDYEGSINAMLGATSVAVTAGLVTNVASSMMKGINQPQRSGVKRVCSKKACKARGYKAKQFKTKGTGNSWGGDFSNVGW